MRDDVVRCDDVVLRRDMMVTHAGATTNLVTGLRNQDVSGYATRNLSRKPRRHTHAIKMLARLHKPATGHEPPTATRARRFCSPPQALRPVGVALCVYVCVLAL